MNKDDLVRKATKKLKEKDYKKGIPPSKHSFSIADAFGNSRKFNIRDGDREVHLAQHDVEAVADALIEVIKEALSAGDEISIRGFGRLYLHYRQERALKEPLNDIWHSVPAHWVPKFKPGNDLTLCARRYETEALQSEQADASGD